MKLAKIAAVAALAASLFTANEADATTVVTWNDETYTAIDAGGSSNNLNFNSAEITFAGFASSELSDVTGGGSYHNHGAAGTVYSMFLRLDGIWTLIWSDSGAGASMDSITTPIGFATGIVSGIRLTSSVAVNQAWHLQSNTAFAFAPVPVPASLPLLLAGVAGLGLLGRRARS